MCIIIDKNNNKNIGAEMLSRCSILNPHGGGVLWLDTYQVEYFDSKDWEILDTTRPYVGHFRYKTIGAECISNNHPFLIGDTGCVLFQNGSNRTLGDSDTTDTEELADILAGTQREHWDKILGLTDSRYVIADTINREYKRYGTWSEHEGTWYSKDNVLETTLVAVYGTLKRGGSNHRLLAGSKMVLQGTTCNKYRMVATGVPFVLPYNSEGHNIDIETYALDDGTLEQVDRLEGHPNWYKREVVCVKDKDDKKLHAHLYINAGANDTGEWLQSFKVRGYEKWNSQGVLHFGQAQDDDCIYDGIICETCSGTDTKYDEFYDSLFCNECERYTNENVLANYYSNDSETQGKY